MNESERQDGLVYALAMKSDQIIDGEAIMTLISVRIKEMSAGIYHYHIDLVLNCKKKCSKIKCRCK